VAVLSVAAERERIGRDLHDILGHSLTAISIKAGLAARLVDQDATAARSEIADIEDIARRALDDVRATASGYREVSLATEIASARSVLLAAGVEARVPSAVEPVPRAVSELFGYVVREAVTNVVRHSEATTCTVELTRDSVSITDDGRGFVPGAPTGGSAHAGGSGLNGLAARVDAAGGRFSVRSEPGRGTVVRAELLTSPTAQVGTPAELGSR
jgi:two-component system sensor histidine kinase DesK